MRLATCFALLLLVWGCKAAPDRDYLVLTRGNSELAFDLYRRLAPRQGNLFFSPHSLGALLAMTAAGARGATSEQMAKVLRLPAMPVERHRAYRSLLRATHLSDDDTVLVVANALWADRTIRLDPEFARTAETFYQAQVMQVDYRAGTEEARRAMNAWVSGRTMHVIRELISREMLSAETRLLPANAIYFRGAWKTPFPRTFTRDDLFLLEGGGTVEVPLMTQVQRHFRYAEDRDVQLLELPYRGERVSMLLALPRQGRRAELERQLDAAWLERRLADLRLQKVDVTMPKLTMARTLRLGPVLEAMGMRLALSGAADFSGMTSGRERLFGLSEVVQQAFVVVDELGTVAAGASRCTLSDPDYPVFRANRPFIFLILDHQTGTILFMGRVMDPSSR